MSHEMNAGVSSHITIVFAVENYYRKCCFFCPVCASLILQETISFYAFDM